MKSVFTAAFVATSILSAASISTAQVQRPKQYILISFDGSYTSAMWKATREHALATDAKVTHFISGVDFLTGSDSRDIPGAMDSIYQPPRKKPNSNSRSDIGFGGTHAEVAERIRQMNASMEAGMEIGGHGNSHFDGSSWTKDEWTYEFNHFFDYVYNVFGINSLDEDEVGVKVSSWKSRLFPELKSFRAPYLGRGKGLWDTLGKDTWQTGGRTNGPIVYDASDINESKTTWPEKDPRGFWYFRMSTIPVPGQRRPVLSMDWNMVVADAQNPNNPEAWKNISPERSAVFEENTYQAYVNWLMNNYYGNRAPLNIGHHFSTWNGGAYWRALKRFMSDVCQQPEVACIRGTDLAKILDKTPSSTLEAYRTGDFDRKGMTPLEIARKSPIAFSEDRDAVYPWTQNAVADLPHQKGMQFHWRAGETKLTKRLKLKELAEKGISNIDLVRVNEKGQEDIMPFYIAWNPLAGTAELIHRLEPISVPCTGKTHDEKVNPAYLQAGEEI